MEATSKSGRSAAERVPLTQEYLAMMLGTGRSGVTIAAATLQQAGSIEYRHGSIRLLDFDRFDVLGASPARCSAR